MTEIKLNITVEELARWLCNTHNVEPPLPTVPKFTGISLNEARRIAARMLAAEALYAALTDVPSPEDEGRCDTCSIERRQDGFHKWPALTRDNSKGYPRVFFLHSESCWYGKIQQALALADGKEEK